MEELSSTYRPDLSQRIIEILKSTLWSRHLETQQGELFNVTVKLPASNSTTTSLSSTVGTFGTTPRHRRRSNEAPQSFSQAVSPRRLPEKVTPHVVTPPNNWDQL
ncbi:hypothetical protein Glove_114g125 [Diversispora epigaea]|uniref:Uncharacterized protein n=1 Tax=Diversispora epigaea TaxID=1348612 RepID=A0A397JA40_9GLOM|nr:hypothetical protein Glove_114g125 [Diversispora epigaea]